MDTAWPEVSAAPNRDRHVFEPPLPSAPLSCELLRAILKRANIGLEDFERALGASRIVGCDVADELVALGFTDAPTLARAIAQTIGRPFGLPSPRDRIVEGIHRPDARMMRTCSLALDAKLFIVPRLETIERTADWLTKEGGAAIVVTTMDALRAHHASFTSEHRSRNARLAFSAEQPDFSARTVFSAGQAYGAGLLTCGLVLAAALLGTLLWTIAHAALSLLFCACTLFRFVILLDFGAERVRAERERRENALQLPVGSLPVYTVLVALYREEAMVPALVEALKALNWPRTRLDIKLVCEADDAGTLDVVRRAIEGETGFELVHVPPSQPRTKPKALNHALPLARGEFLVLYDAEDRPDPDQLLEAWLAFRAAGPDLGCVQAPLVIRNGRRNWLAGLFALEYAVLFRAVLPYLARRRLPIALGGTSNHFRLSVLTQIGAWDSHNVAEDADLGIRLARRGYRTDVISASTSEIAPERLRDWRNQRTRWMKGWIQTYCVHMRQPLVTLKELGPMRMASFQLLFISMMASAAMHTAFVLYLAVVLANLAFSGAVVMSATWLTYVDVFNIAAAGAVFAALASRSTTREEKPLMRWLWRLWLYWLLVSFAGARSVVQLFRAPHQWEKTPHWEAALVDPA